MRLNPLNLLEEEGGLPTVRREMDELFGDFLRTIRLAPYQLERQLGRTGALRPPMDFWEDDQHYHIDIELPGIRKRDVEVSVDDERTLTISGEFRLEQEREDRSYHRMERCGGSFRRTLTLPGDADTEQIKARFADGVLTVTIPRKGDKEGSARRKVAIE